MPKRWIIKTPDPLLQKEFSDALGIHPIIAQLLINRNISSINEAKHFLFPDLASLYNPFLLADMDRAVERILLAKQRREKVLIYGDYDVDGVTSSALLRRVLKRLDIKAINYIPHRMEEGYGLNESVAVFAKEQGIALIISVDCGINAFEPIKAIKAQGIDMIVIDHHEPEGEHLPDALAVIDPKRHDCLYPFKMFSAVGLVAKLSQAIFGVIHEEDLDLVAIGTIADVVALRGENRILVKHGLPLIETTSKEGLKALLQVTKIAGKKMKPYYIGFILGPRLNAAGRMDSANISLDLLLSETPFEALALAQSLEAHNSSRQKMQSAVVEEAMAMIEGDLAIKEQPVLVIAKEGWHKGVLGIVASRIVDKYYRPTVVISIENGLATGSARSIEGFALNEAFSQCASMLDNFGGHKRAAGLRLKSEHVDAFRIAINEIGQGLLTAETLVPTLNIDCEIPLNSLDIDLVKIVESMEPHGEGNPSPVFCSRNLTVKSSPVVMGRDTIKFWVSDGEKSFVAVGFGMGSMKDKLRLGSQVNVAYALDIDDWNKAPAVQLTLKDIEVL